MLHTEPWIWLSLMDNPIGQFYENLEFKIFYFFIFACCTVTIPLKGFNILIFSEFFL